MLCICFMKRAELYGPTAVKSSGSGRILVRLESSWAKKCGSCFFPLSLPMTQPGSGSSSFDKLEVFITCLTQKALLQFSETPSPTVHVYSSKIDCCHLLETLQVWAVVFKNRAATQHQRKAHLFLLVIWICCAEHAAILYNVGKHVCET